MTSSTARLLRSVARVSRRFTACLGLCLFGLVTGIAGARAFDGSEIRTARIELGGEGILPLLNLFVAWIGVVQHARSPLELVVPELVEGSMNEALRQGAGNRELAYADRLTRFELSPKVSPELRERIHARCWSLRATHPIECHACAAQVLDELAERESETETLFTWLIALSGAALGALFAWRLAAKWRRSVGDVDAHIV